MGQAYIALLLSCNEWGLSQKHNAYMDGTLHLGRNIQASACGQSAAQAMFMFFDLRHCHSHAQLSSPNSPIFNMVHTLYNLALCVSSQSSPDPYRDRQVARWQIYCSGNSFTALARIPPGLASYHLGWSFRGGSYRKLEQASIRASSECRALACSNHHHRELTVFAVLLGRGPSNFPLRLVLIVQGLIHKHIYNGNAVFKSYICSLSSIMAKAFTTQAEKSRTENTSARRHVLKNQHLMSIQTSSHSTLA